MQRHRHDRRVKRARPLSLALSHIAVALGAALIFLYFLDLYNQGSMSFMDNVYTRGMTCALGALAIANGIDLMIAKNKNARLERENARLRNQREK